MTSPVAFRSARKYNASMKHLYHISVFLFLVLRPITASGQEAALFQSQQNLRPSLVTIKAFSFKAGPSESGQAKISGSEQQGNGVIIDTSGVIVTNNHVVANMKYVFVTLSDGKIFKADVIYTGESDFCFLKIPAPKRLKAIARADFSRIKAGEPVVALLHSQKTLTGTVSRLIQESGSNEIGLIELKLELHPGDSGGPVFSEEGALLGLIMARQESDTTTGYAISSHKIWEEYQKYNGSVLIGDGK